MDCRPRRHRECCLSRRRRGHTPAGEAGQQDWDRLPIRLAGCIRRVRDFPSRWSARHPRRRTWLAPQPHDAPDRHLRLRAAAPDASQRLSDRIAHVALRCAVLLAKFEAAAGPVDRSGSGPIAEVYPAASLRSWGLDHRGYKQKTATGALAGLVDRLLDEAPWLDCTTHEQDMRQSHDIFDAVIAAMTARAAALCQTIPPAADDLAAAAAEGWIVIPDKPISALL